MPEVQGGGRPRAIGWQRAARGTSLRPLFRSSATAVGTAGQWPGGTTTEPGRPRNWTRPAPNSGLPKNLELRRPAGTMGPTGSALGMLGTQLGLSAREEEPPGGAGGGPVLSPSPFPPTLS